jgi:hypothetical protein
MLLVMDGPVSPADELPALYRAILDGLAPLERTSARPEALRIRARASRIYAQSWSENGRRSLHSLLRRIERVTANLDRAGNAKRPAPVGRSRWRSARRPIPTR